MTDWNYADVWELVASVFPDRPALVHGAVRRDWTAFDRRADAVAAALVASGVPRQAKVAQYLYNCPEYLESVFACFKAAFVPVNTNYRYTDDELVYLWDNADAEAVIFHGTFTDTVERLRSRLPRVRSWWFVADGAGACPEWALDYESVAASGTVLTSGPPRSGDDLLLMYTGGTTGMPKGVMWRQDDLLVSLNRTAALRYPEHGTLDDVRQILEEPTKHPPRRTVLAPPLMHGSSLFSSMSLLAAGGCAVLLPTRKLDVAALLDTIERERATELLIVGDAFARPIVDALDAEPDRWDISSLWMVFSSGAMWSADIKARLLAHNQRLMLVDALGSSEAIGVARSTSRANETTGTATFVVGDDTKVFTEDGTEVAAGSGEPGKMARRGRGPIGYYKDPEKSAQTFVTMNGERWTITGDWATVDADGVVQLLGRGSVCINSGGEKIFPEEVEEALKRHSSVADVVVVGVPDERFGESVTAVVELRPEQSTDAAELIQWVRRSLAAYKAPRHVLFVPTVGRQPNGKVDYRRVRGDAIEELKGART